jgi:hypothetical protein
MSTESANQFASLRQGLDQMMKELPKASNTENAGAKQMMTASRPSH